MKRFLIEVVSCTVLVLVVAGLFLHWSILSETSPSYLQEQRSRTGDAGWESGFEVAVVGADAGDRGFDEGVRLAWEETNRSKSPLAGKVRLVYFADPTDAVDESPAEEVAARSEVVAVLGHEGSENAVRDSITYETHGILFLATRSTLPVLTTHDFRYSFRLNPDDRGIAEALVEFLKGQGLKRIGVVSARTSHGQSLAQRFVAIGDERGLDIAFSRSYLPRQSNWKRSDFRPLAAEILREPFDALLIADEVPRAAKLVFDLVRMGVKQPIVGSDKMDSNQLWELAGEAANRVYVASTYDPSSESLEFLSFRRRFRERYGVEPSYDSTQGYEAFELLAQAIERSHTANPVVVATTLRTSTWKGLFGEFSFNLNGDALGRKILIKRMQNGVWEKVPLCGGEEPCSPKS